MLTLNSTRVILLRHGESTYNALGLYQGSSDQSLLTETGIAQAQQVGEYLKNIPINKIYISPLQRAQKTATEILKAFAPQTNSLEIASLLKEVNLPLWEGLSFEYVKENFSENYSLWKKFPHQFYMKLADTQAKIDGNVAVATCEKKIFPALDIYERALKFWQQILPRHWSNTILVVSHGGTNRALIGTALGLSPGQYHQLQQCNCAINVLDFPEYSFLSARLSSFNLPPNLETLFTPKPETERGLKLLLVPVSINSPQNVTKLTNLLKQVKIDFSVSGDLYHSQATTQLLLQEHPTTLQLELLQEDFPKYWLQQIKLRNQKNSDSLLTGLVVANESIIKQILAQALGLNHQDVWRLKLYPENLSIVHYPKGESLPFIQAINIPTN